MNKTSKSLAGREPNGVTEDKAYSLAGGGSSPPGH